MDLTRYTALFVSESRDLLQACNAHLLAWEAEPGAVTAVDGLFRAVHTIKGMAATLGFDRLAHTAHSVEHVLASVRDGSVPVTAEVISQMFLAVDRIEEGVRLAAVGDDARFDSAELEAALAAVARPATATFPVPNHLLREEGPGQSELPDARVPDTVFVRVDRARLDRLLGLAGELVVAQRRLAATSGGREHTEGLHALGRLVDTLHAEALRVRMAPMQDIFERFPRAVRDVARSLGRDVRLETSGGEIELDRGVLDVLPEPLLHLLRNAIDHGIEPPEERRRLGKETVGVIRVIARRDRAHAVVVVEDDGAGIHRAAVRARAAALGWTLPEPLDDALLCAVLARPGFSTAEAVSAVSGRGVGFDAVVRTVERLGGSVSLTSREGAGTRVTLRFPLTRAVVPSLLVGVDGERYALPLGAVVEATRVGTVTEETLPWRGQALPVVRLARGDTRRDRRAGVVLAVGARRGALLVDTLVGQEQIVVSPLDPPVGTPSWVHGATILADGRPALVVDPAALV